MTNEISANSDTCPRPTTGLLAAKINCLGGKANIVFYNSSDCVGAAVPAEDAAAVVRSAGPLDCSL